MIKKEELSVIIVDDLQFSCEVVKSGLKKSGYKDIRTANSANDAMLLLNQRRADVILADFWMPEMNGLEMTDLIRRWDESNNRYTGIILLTAEDNTSSIVVAFDRGVDDFLSKSVNQFELAARVFGAGRTAWLQNQLRKKNNDLSNQYQNYHHLSLMDADTGLANRKQLERSMDSMISHCETRGGGFALAMIRLTVDSHPEAGQEPLKIRKGTLRTVSNSLQLVLRPMDQIARYDECTFAIALVYADLEAFSPDMFERSTSSILKHTHQKTDKGEKLLLSMATWNTDQFDPVPNVMDILLQTENSLKPLEIDTDL
ncbi:MAG: response regulator [Gammaproteobacteria bacterium]|nr:response regulator [Gammaproteobacteria bacterium]